MTQKQADSMYLNICQIIARQSHAQRAKVGALIVRDENIISFGFNGTPSGRNNCCEYRDENGQEHSKPEVLHAESNAFMKLCKTGSSRGCQGATMYCTYSPCYDCAKMIVQAGIKRVVYLKDYRLKDGLDLLQDCGIEVEQFPMNDFVNAEYHSSDVMFE